MVILLLFIVLSAPLKQLMYHTLENKTCSVWKPDKHAAHFSRCKVALSEFDIMYVVPHMVRS